MEHEVYMRYASSYQEKPPLPRKDGREMVGEIMITLMVKF